MKQMSETLGKRKRAAEEHARWKRLHTVELPGRSDGVKELESQAQELKSEHDQLLSELEKLRDLENEVLRLDLHNLQSLHSEYLEARERHETTSAMQSSVFNQLRPKAVVNNEWQEIQSELGSLEPKVSVGPFSLDLNGAKVIDPVFSRVSGEGA